MPVTLQLCFYVHKPVQREALGGWHQNWMPLLGSEVSLKPVNLESRGENNVTST